MFGVDDSLKLALVARNVGVVVVRHDIKSGLAERQFGVVEVKNVGLILIHQVLAAEEPLFSERRIHRRWVLVPHAVVLLVPLIPCLDARDAVGHTHVASGVEFLRVQALPPLALAIGLRQPRRRSARRPVALRRRIHRPPETSATREPVVADAEAQPVGARDFGPRSNDVLLRADVDRVPGVITSVVGVEVVVVVGEGEEVFRARTL